MLDKDLTQMQRIMRNKYKRFYQEEMDKSIIDQTGVKINIDDDGIVSIMSRDHDSVDKALEIVKNLTRTIEIGEVYTGLD